MDERRLMAIENHLQHQEALLQDLHQVIYQQQEAVAFLQRKVHQLEDRASLGIEAPPSQKPPHY